jgi:hypothetical protein
VFLGDSPDGEETDAPDFVTQLHAKMTGPGRDDWFQPEV